MKFKRPYSFRKFAGGFVTVFFYQNLPSQAILSFDKPITFYNGWLGITCKLAADPTWLAPSNITQTGPSEVTVDLPFDGTAVNYEVNIDSALSSEIQWGGNTLTDVFNTPVPFPIYHLYQNGGAIPPP